MKNKKTAPNPKFQFKTGGARFPDANGCDEKILNNKQCEVNFLQLLMLFTMFIPKVSALYEKNIFTDIKINANV